jgi:hypothetical protein
MSVVANSAFVERLRISAVRIKSQSQHAVEQVVTRELWVIMKDGLPHVPVVVYIQRIFHIPLIVCLYCASSLRILKANL